MPGDFLEISGKGLVFLLGAGNDGVSGIFGKLMELDGDINVIPGHGPATSIATERMTNPFLMPFNEPFEE